MESKELTGSKKRIYDYIRDYYIKHGYCPSYEEIMVAVELNSKSVISRHMKYLFDVGLLESDFDDEISRPRAYRPKGFAVICADFSHYQKERVNDINNSMYQ